MSLWGVHVGVGMLVATLLVGLSGWDGWWRWAVILLSGFWAIVPDLYHLMPWTKEWFKPAVHDSWVANVFWFHRVFDRVDGGDSVVLSLMMFGMFLVVFVVVEWWVGRGEGRR